MKNVQLSLNTIERMLNTLVIFSNVFIMISGIIFLQKHPYVGYLLLIISIISTIHHSNCHIDIWGKLDLLFAFGGTIIICIYALLYIYHHSYLPVFQTRRSVMIGLCTMILFVYGIGMAILAKVCPADTGKNEQCTHIQYLIYHSLWHVLIGIASMFLAIFMIVD